MSELDEVVTSAVVVFSSSHSDRNVGKHFENLQGLLTNSAQLNLDDSTIVEDCVNDIGPTPFKQHFEDLITQTVIEKSGDDNMYFCPTFIPSLLKYFLPLAGLWSGLLLGDLGRHGTGTIYQKRSQKYKNAAKKPTQNYTEDNKTQGIMEKSQWDLKKIRFQRRRLTRLDDFVHTYKVTLSALLREYGDSLRRGKKTHRVDMERWKKRKQNRRGVYVTPINKPFVFRQHKKNLMQKTKTAKAPAPLQKQAPGETEAHIPSQDPKDKARQGQSSSTSDMTEHAEDDAQGGKVDASSELTALWEKKDTEVVVSVVPTQIRGNSFTIRHSDMRTLRPHQWLTGEIIECLFHIHAHKCELGTRIYILNHYSAGVILFGKREEVMKHTLSKIHFDSYGAIVSFVHVDGIHWKFLYINAEESTVYLADPARNSAEQAESDNAANKCSDYFKMRRTCCSKTDWVDIKWKRGVMKHPVQQDGNSCGVVVCMMAKEVMEVFPKTPTMAFGTTKKEMAHQRKVLAMEILTASVFDKEVNCAMCAGIKPPGSVPHHTHTDWIQCDSCFRWCHTQCLHMDQKSLEEAQVGDWVCSLCDK
ncbi:uncharacterized protein LOC117537216 [Gymnodraco acuticeps]|uniref:Uncharacterized protein LOC117537216 n=1 Tax=Gymnodraco acuticeps TaxID=8218 RepID=A0A6P8T3W8_GYMAC|nr:uncharacterized protein LOC117537216 [Gymnodraco acuticeps]